MSCRSLVKFSLGAAVISVLALGLGCAGKPAPVPAKTAPVVVAALPTVPARPVPPPVKLPKVMLGIDVLEADGFRAIAGKKIGLLTHPAGVNARGESTLKVLLRAPQSKIIALFAPEHGFDGEIKAGANFGDTVHVATGLPVYSLHGANRKPTKKQLQGLDAMVVDLQDIGVRSYTFNVVMRLTMDACFENGVEVIVLDRPNPLGGLKVDGPPLDPENMSGVGAFPRMPYVHGLTIGEIARMAKGGSRAIAGMAVTETVRAKGELTVIPMRGWTRNMLWPDTELKWIPTSPNIPTYESVIGYAMVGLGTQDSGWKWGIGRDYHFRGIGYPKKTPDEIIATMNTYKIPGIRLVKKAGIDTAGKAITGVYVEVSDWDDWHPTELAFYMHKQAAKWERLNPFSGLTVEQIDLFKKHVGSTAWYNAIRRDGTRVDVQLFLKNWTERAKTYQDLTRKFWIYPWASATPATPVMAKAPAISAPATAVKK